MGETRSSKAGPHLPPAASAELGVGELLFDEFRVERLLGEGGYGSVHLVVSQATGEQYALKRALLEDDSGRADLLVEVKAWMNVPSYPHIAACRFFRIAGPAVCIFAEYVDGGSLADALRSGALYAGGVEIALPRILQIAIQTAWGLDAAHQSDLVHQDVKPSNILLTADGLAKVCDFGLTEKGQPDAVSESLLEYLIQDIQEPETRERIRGPLRDQLHVDQQFPVAGRGSFTACYASPEQLGGGVLTSASDVWSWGVTVLEIFNGKCTWQLGSDAPAALSELAAAGPAISGPPPLSPRIAAVIDRCFQAEPAQRWSTLSEAATELAAARGQTLPMPPVAKKVAATFTRRLPTGSSWADPRGWISHTYSLAGMSEADALLHFPDPTGSVVSRAVSDFETYEHALNILAPLYQSGRRELAGDLARVHGNLAQVCGFLGQTPEALAHYDACIALLAPSSEWNDQIDAATAWNSKAIALRKAGRAPESVRTCDEALAFWRGIAPAPPPGESNQVLAMLLTTKANAVADPLQRLQLRTDALALPELDEASCAKYLAGQASDFAVTGDWAQYEQTVQRARSLLEHLIHEERRHDLDSTLGFLAMNCALWESQRSQFHSAHDHLVEAIAILQPLVAQQGQSELAENIGECYFADGRALEALGRPLDALAAYAAAREQLSEIVLRAGRSGLANQLGEAFRNEANLNRALGRIDDALRLSEHAVNLFRRLATGDRRRHYLTLLARALSVQSGCLLADDRVEASVEAAREAVDLFRSLPPEDPDRKSPACADSLMEFGVAMRRAGDPQTTWDCYQEALSILDAIDGLDALNLKALIQSNSSNLLGDAGELAASVAFLQDAIGTWSEIERRGGTGAVREELVMAHKALFNQLLKIGSYQEARKESDLALPMLAQMVNEGRDDLRPELAKLWGARAVLLKKIGDFENSIAAFTESAAAFRAATSRHQQPLLESMTEFMLRQADDVKDLAALRVEDAPKWAARAQETVRDSTQMSRAGDTFHGSELIDDAIIIYSVLASRQPEPGRLQTLAETHMSKAIMSMHAHRDVAAEQSFRSAMEYYDRLIHDFHQPAQLENWGRACLGLATFLKAVRRPAECDALMNVAQVRMQSLGKAKYGQWQRTAGEVLKDL